MTELSGYERETDEVRRWKAKVSKKIRDLGMPEYHKRSAKENADFNAQVEMARHAKLLKSSASNQAK